MTDDSQRAELVRTAVADWARRLVTLDGRNRMLYFRELPRGTLELSPTNEYVRAGALELLLTGGSVKLSELFVPEGIADAAHRMRAIAAKALSNFEEKGLATLYIGHSFARWDRPGGHVPRAPVVMIPVRALIEGQAGDDAVLKVAGPAEVNLPFSYAIQHDSGIDPYPPVDERSRDFRGWPEHVRRVCAEIPGFSLDDRLFLANLEFSKLPMVADMEQNLNMLVGNTVVAAMAGDPAARTELGQEPAIDIDLPDRTPPQDEYLVCDADASQNYAVEAALRGHSLVVHGPPGTGKSQTIANLISSLAARGKSVLFVAEKRAAIGAVTRRLDEAGCGQLVLDLHDGSRRRHVAASLGASIDAIDHLLANVEVTPFDELAATRQTLVAHRRQMHAVRERFGLAFSGIQALLGTPGGKVTGLRLDDDALELWTVPGRQRALGLLGERRALADRLDGDTTGIWSSSLIHSVEDATLARTTLAELVEVLVPGVEDAFRISLEGLSLPVTTDVPVDQFADVVSTVAELSSRYESTFMDRAAEFARMLQPAERSRVRRLMALLLDRHYRKALRDLRQSGRIAAPGALAALDDARRAANAQQAWADWFPDHPMRRRTDSGAVLVAALYAYRQARDRLAAQVPALAKMANLAEESAAMRGMLEHQDLAEVKAQMTGVTDEIARLGMEPLLHKSIAGQVSDNDLSALAMHVFAASAIDRITWQEPELAMFDGAHHQDVADRFAELDKRHLHLTANRVMREVAARAATVLEDEPRQAALVRHETGISEHHIPVRALVSRAPNVVKALRPCWAMSPLLVSQMLPATPNLFDVVIFDEASQVLPIDAVPAIARGAQLVVAGDPHQLPPRQFRASESLEDETTDSSSAGTAVAESGSILDVMRDLLIEGKLQWHYRSLDERLINFSNTHTYSRLLVTFPGTNRGTGIRHVLAEGLPDTATRTASNPHVVSRVVELILEHARDHPNESLGVVATGLSHAGAIIDATRVARVWAEDDFSGFFDKKGSEPFFIKTMDQVQGDERDHVIFSVGYGKNPEGEMVYRWGSLGRKGGERRLNVAVTRAKRRMTVVSSVASQEIDSTRATSGGAPHLVKFLEYAERGGDSTQGHGEAGPLALFETSVRDRLQAAGIPLEPHFGIGRLRMDFAAFDHADTRRPVLAIETDGVGYNSMNTARDRDRLRLEVLHKRGWRYHRIWSRDWYRDPDAETAKVVAAWELAVSGSTDPTLRHRDRSSADRPIVAGRGRSPVRISGAGILDYSRADLVRLLEWIQSDGVTRTDDELLAEAAKVLGFKDAGGRTGRALRAAIKIVND